MRVVLDPNVLISATLSPSGSPARIVLAWQRGLFELVVSPLLLAELSRALAYPKLRKRITQDEAARYVTWLSSGAIVAEDQVGNQPVRCVDPDDDYLIALAAAEGAVLVSGDGHLLALSGEFPVSSPADFLASLAE